MNVIYVKKYTILAILFIAFTPHPSMAKKTKKNGSHRSSETTERETKKIVLPTNATTEFNGTDLSTLDIKDLIVIFENYILSVVDSGEPFSKVLPRLSGFCHIFYHASQAHPILTRELEKFKEVYQREFGITEEKQLSEALLKLAIASRSLHKSIDQNRKVSTLIQSMSQFVTYLKKSLPPTFGKRIEKLEEKFKSKLHAGMIGNLLKCLRS